MLMCGPNLLAGPPVEKTTPVRQPVCGDTAEDEDQVGELDPALRLQVLSAILIVSTDDLQSTVTQAPPTSSVTPSTGGESGGGQTTGGPSLAPEPASLVLGGVGTGLALVAGVLFRRHRRKNVV
jgi:hypothetical protein